MFLNTLSLRRLLSTHAVRSQQHLAKRQINATSLRQYAMISAGTTKKKSADRISHEIEPEEGVGKPSVKDNVVMVNFIDKKGYQKTVPGYVGQTLLEVAHNNGIELGMEDVCQGAGSCAECHVLIANEWYNTLPQTSFMEDSVLEDNLKQVEMLSKNSRLACQIVMEKEYDGLVVAVAEDESDFHFHFSPF